MRSVLLAALLALAPARVAMAQERAVPAAPVRVIDTLVLAPEAFGPAFGGISGIDYDRRQHRWLLLSDDRSDHAAARFYTVRMARDARGWRLRGLRRVPLRDVHGGRFPAAGGGGEAVDPEAIRVTPDDHSLIWSSEGDAKDGYGPAVRRMDRRGRTIASVALPGNLRFDPTGARGTRDNGTLEGIDFTPDGALWLAMEMPLIEDGPTPGDDHAALVRFTRLREGAPAQQFAYPVDAVPAAARGGDNGVAEILAIDDRRMLVLERAGAKDAGGVYRFHCRLYLADFAAAEDVSARASLDGAGVTPATKRLLFDFDGLADDPGNLEAMAWWPSAPGAPDHLVIANDNNFVAGEPTRLLLLSLAP